MLASRPLTAPSCVRKQLACAAPRLRMDNVSSGFMLASPAAWCAFAPSCIECTMHTHAPSGAIMFHPIFSARLTPACPLCTGSLPHFHAQRPSVECPAVGSALPHLGKCIYLDYNATTPVSCCRVCDLCTQTNCL